LDETEKITKALLETVELDHAADSANTRPGRTTNTPAQRRRPQPNT
jgi:hypothetical protein